MSNEKEISRLKLMEFSNFTASKKKQAFYSGFIQTEKKGCMRPRRIWYNSMLLNQIFVNK